MNILLCLYVVYLHTQIRKKLTVKETIIEQKPISQIPLNRSLMSIIYGE